MKRRTFFLIAALLAGCLFVWLAASRVGESAIAFEPDLVYGKGGDTDLHLNLAMPSSGHGPFPAVVFLHGKGWRSGDRSEMNSLVEGIARLGYVGVTVEYRLVPRARFPAQVEDCKAAIRFLRAHATQYRIDPGKIGVVGFSAGGYLAAMLGVTTSADGFEGNGGSREQSSEVQTVVSFFGPTDFTTRDWPADLETEVIAPFLGGSFADRPEVYRRASPVNFVRKGAAPFLFFHGTEDVLVPIDQSRRLALHLQQVGVSAPVVVFEREGHGFTDATNQIAMKQMLEFLGKHFGK
jgi:acetyl esterase/lipase